MSDLVKHYRQLLAIAKHWAMHNLTGWCDDTHRDLIARHGAVQIEGRVTASSMNMPQLAAALEDYERRGWPRKRQYRGADKAAPKAVPPRISTMVKLWGKLGQAGKVRQPNRASLITFCVKQAKRDIKNLDDLSVQECQRITEALKSWLAR